MTDIMPSESVLVLDLDDTLYAEYDYKISGIKAVCAKLQELYGFDAGALFAQTDTAGSGWLDQICAACGLNSAEQQSLLWVYRLHTPDIAPYMPSEQLAALAGRFAGSALISDGRSLTQRLKLEALGLAGCFGDILISEACGSDKPDPARFAAVAQKYPGKRCIYVGDNIKKDFVTPKRMGWLTIGIRPSRHNIHRHDEAAFPPEYHPDLWLDSVAGIETLLQA